MQEWGNRLFWIEVSSTNSSSAGGSLKNSVSMLAFIMNGATWSMSTKGAFITLHWQKMLLHHWHTFPPYNTRLSRFHSERKIYVSS